MNVLRVRYHYNVSITGMILLSSLCNELFDCNLGHELGVIMISVKHLNLT